MTRPRPCGCKGCRTCLICETQYGAEKLKLHLPIDQTKCYVYCPLCNKAWKGWDIDLYKQHPNHEGESVDFPGIYIQLEFITEEEEKFVMTNIDEMPWDTSQSGRRKQNFGPKTNFKKKRVVNGNFDGFPEFSKFIQQKFDTVELLKGYEVIEQCSLEYDPNKGASIDPHIDDCWIWGERIVTVNFLADSALTMIPYKGDIQKYNLQCSNEYNAIINDSGKVILDNENLNITALQATKPVLEKDIIVRIPMPRKSLLVIYGEPRYHWEHCVLREDVMSRRVCLAYREFTPPYMNGGCHKDIGEEIRKRAKQFWNHRTKYDVQNMLNKEN